MRQYPRWYLLISLGLGHAVIAQPRGIEALRYVNSEGIEVIRNRDLPLPSSSSGVATAPPVASSSAKRGTLVGFSSDAVSKERSPQPAKTSSVQADGKDKQSAAASADRTAILTAELINEVRELDTKRKLLKSPRGTNDLVDQMYTRLEREVLYHEENIRGLNREMRRSLTP